MFNFKVPATFLKQMFPSTNQGETTSEPAGNQSVLQTLVPPSSALDVDVEMGDTVEPSSGERSVVRAGTHTGVPRSRGISRNIFGASPWRFDSLPSPTVRTDAPPGTTVGTSEPLEKGHPPTGISPKSVVCPPSGTMEHTTIRGQLPTISSNMDPLPGWLGFPRSGISIHSLHPSATIRPLGGPSTSGTARDHLFSSPTPEGSSTNRHALNELSAFGDPQRVHSSQLVSVQEQSPQSSSEDDVTMGVTAENQRRQSLEQGLFHRPHSHISAERSHSRSLQEPAY